MTPTKRTAPSSGAMDAATHALKRRPPSPYGVTRRGDGFTEIEATGMLQLVRAHWRDGWDTIAVLHNQQHPGHNRSADSLKKKFSRLYRATLPPRGMKNYAVIALAQAVHLEMREGSAPSVGDASTTESLDETATDTGMFSLPPTMQSDGSAVADTGGEWEEAASRGLPPAALTPTQPRAPHRISTPAPVASTPTSSLLTAVLQTILQSQHQRDMDREVDRARWEEERACREEERKQWREAEERRRAEEREEQRRRDAIREEERAEDRRRHEQLMQVMLMLVSKDSSGQPPNAD